MRRRMNTLALKPAYGPNRPIRGLRKGSDIGRDAARSPCAIVDTTFDCENARVDIHRLAPKIGSARSELLIARSRGGAARRGSNRGFVPQSPASAHGLEWRRRNHPRPRTCRRLRWDNGRLTKSELIQRIAHTQSHLVERDIALAVHMMLEHMAARLAGGGRIEIRSFGSFSVRFRRARVGRNPRTGTPVSLPARHAPYFKPGKDLRERVNRGSESSLKEP